VTYEEVVENALSRGLDFDAEFPSTRLPMYRRVGVRQQQIFNLAARKNPDYYGVQAAGTLDANFRISLADLVGHATLDQATAIQSILILDAGASAYAAGDEVNIVSIDDVDGDLAPRVTIRDRIIQGVGTDLTSVVSLCVKYSRVPDPAETDEDGSTAIEVHEPHVELLVIDLTIHLARKTLSMEPEVKAAVISSLREEEKELLTVYFDEVINFALGQHHRFSEPVGTATR